MSTEEASRDLFNQVLSTTFLQSFRLTDSMAQQPWAITLTKNILRPHDVLVSLNYSHLLDSLLDSAEIWNPNGGYSRYVTNINLDTSPSIPPNSALKDIRLYKIHGSCHFYRVAFSDRPDLQQINFPVEPEIFPISGANSHFGPGIPNRGHYIVAPSFVKIPHIQLTFMFLDVLEHVKSTQNLVVLGCNLRYEDQALWLMLSKFLSGPPNGRKIIILQPNAEEVRKRMVKHLSWMAMAWDSFIIAIPKTIEAGARDLLEYL
jgi:hypothetical protein